MLPFNWDTVKRNYIEWLCCQTVCSIKRILDLSQCKYRVQQLNNAIVLVLVGGFRHNTQKNMKASWKVYQQQLNNAIVLVLVGGFRHNTQKNMRVSWNVYQHNNAKHCIS